MLTLNLGIQKALALLCVLCFVFFQPTLAVFANTSEENKFSASTYLELPNGLKVILIETQAFPVISCLMWYHTGASNDARGKTGTAHVLEHLLFGNIGSFKKDGLVSSIVRNGGQFNGYTSDDFITFFETLPSNKLELALKIESERMRNATFTEDDVRNAIEEVNDELDDKTKEPSEILAREVRSLAFLRHPYRNPSIGWKPDIDNLKIADLKELYDRYFWPNNATLVIAGDIQKESAQELVKKYFGAIPISPTPIPDIKIVEPAQRGERQVTITHATKQDALQIAYHCPGVDEEDAPAFVVLEQLLNANYSGRLRSKVNPITKLYTQANSYYEAHKDPSLFTITCQANPGTNLNKLLEGLDGITNQLKTQLVPDTELKRARLLAEFAFHSECDSPYELGFHTGFFDVVSNKRTAKDWAIRLHSVSAGDLQRVARQYLVPENRVVGFLESPVPPPKPPSKAGQEAPKPATKPEPKLPNTKQMDHIPVMGFKLNDMALRPIKRLRAATADKPAADKATTAQDSDTSEIKATVETQEPPVRKPRIYDRITPRRPYLRPRAQQPKPPATQPMEKVAPSPVTTTNELDQLEASEVVEPAKPKMPQVTENWLNRLKYRTLSNGLRIAVLESHISPVVQIRGAIRAGDVYDPANKKGLAEVVAETLNYGNTKHNQQQLRIMQEDLGLPPHSMLRFDCQTETIEFETACLSNNLSSQLSIIAESLISPSFLELDIEKAKQDVISLVRQNEGSLPSRIERTAMRNLIAANSAYYPDDPLSLVRTIPTFRATDVRAFHKEHITPNQTVIVFAGDTTIDEASALVERLFQPWTSMKLPAKPLVKPASRRVVRTTIPTNDKDDARICLAKLLEFSEGNSDYPYLLIADCALASHPLVSRLVLALSKDTKLGQIVNSGTLESKLDPLSNATTWSLSVSVPAQAAAQLVTTVRSEIDSFSKGTLGQMELSECKRYLLGSIPVRSMSSMSTMASTICESLIQDCEPSFASQLLATIRSSNVETLGKFIRNNFKPNQATLIMTGNAESIKAVSAVTKVVNN